MTTLSQRSVVRLTRGECWFLGLAWMLVAAKCLFVQWAVGHWAIPLHAGWIIAPTLFFAAAATWLWVRHKA